MQKITVVFLIFGLCLAAAAGRCAPRYTALGASDAIGTGSSTAPATPNGGYVFVISDWLQARYSSWTLHNLGVSGYTAPDIRDNTLSSAIAEQPRIVTIWAGGNDIKNSVVANEPTQALADRFESAYTTIIQRLRAETGAFVVTANLPDFSRLPVAFWFPPSMKALAKADSDALNAIIARVAEENHIPVMDLYSDPASYDRANYSSDGFHPNDKGYAIMAGKYEAVLQSQAWRLVSGLGDMDADGTVDVPDVGAILRIVGGLGAPDDRQGVAADTYPPGGDGVIDIRDAGYTMQRVAGLVPDADWR